LKIAPLLIPLLIRTPLVRRVMFRTISQTVISYRESSLSEGRVGAVEGGDRLPWVELGSGQDNFTPLESLDWQLHLYGEPRSEIQLLCQSRKLPLHVFPWKESIEQTGLQRDTVYLVRPDGYVALVHPARNSAAAIAAYFDSRRITPAS